MPARISLSFPPAADVQIGQEPKPEPGLEIVTDATGAARERYNAAIEAWGDRGHDAWVRACRHSVDQGASWDFLCGETSSERQERLNPGG